MIARTEDGWSAPSCIATGGVGARHFSLSLLDFVEVDRKGILMLALLRGQVSDYKSVENSQKYVPSFPSSSLLRHHPLNPLFFSPLVRSSPQQSISSPSLRERWERHDRRSISSCCWTYWSWGRSQYFVD